MACNSSNCQSNCYKNDEEQAEDSPSPAYRKSSTSINGQNNLCVKCKANEPISCASVGSGGDDTRFCYGCFRSNLYGKFRLSVTSHAMITPSDNVLVAFSGGPASRFLFLLLFLADDCVLLLFKRCICSFASFSLLGYNIYHGLLRICNLFLLISSNLRIKFASEHLFKCLLCFRLKK